MALNRGDNSGLTGVLDITGTPIVGVRVLAWARNEESPLVDRTGPTDQRKVFVHTAGTGGLVFQGKVARSVYPAPDNLYGQAGTVTLQQDGSTHREVLGVQISSIKFSFNEKTADFWDVSGSCAVTSADLTWSGTQATADLAPAYDRKETNEGRTKFGDPNEMQAGATQRFDIVGMNGGDDDFEWNEILNQIAAATTLPFPNAKLRLVSLARPDYFRAIVTTQWGYTDTIDDQVFPRTQVTDDPSHLTRTETQAAVNDPAPASTLSLQTRRTTTIPYHDNANINVTEYGERTTQQDIEYPGTPTNTEVSLLFSTATVTKVQDNSTISPPAAPVGQHVATTMTRLTAAGKWQAVYHYGSLTEKQKLEFLDSPIGDDPTDLGDEDAQVVQTATSAIPAPAPTPRRDADLQLYRVLSLRVGGTPETWTHKFVFRRNTPKDEIELGGTHTGADPNDIGEAATITQVTNSGTPPATPGAPVGQLVRTETVPLTKPNGAYTGYWRHTFQYGPTTNLQRIEFDGATFGDDPSNLTDADVEKEVTGSSNPPIPNTHGDLKIVRRESVRIQGTPERWLHVHWFGRNTKEDELEHTQRNIDADDFDEVERIPVLHTSGTAAPATPAQEGTAANLVDTRVDRLCVATGGFTGLWLWTFVFGHTTRKQAIEQEGGIDDDQSDLDDQDVQTLTNNSVTPPASPGARIAGQSLVRIRSVRLQNTPQKWKHQYYYGWLTNEERIEHDGTNAAATSEGDRAVAGTPATETLVATCLAGDTVDALLVTNVAALNADATKPWLAAETQKINKTHYQVRIRRPTDDKRIILGSASAGFEQSAITSVAGTHVKVAGVRQESAGQYSYHIEPVAVWRVRQRVGLVRYYRTNDFYVKLWRGLHGTRDSQGGGFLDHPQYTMAYLYTETSANWQEEGGDRWIRCVHWFLYDNWTHVDASGIPTGVRLETDTAIQNGGTYSWSADLDLATGGLSLLATPTNNATYDASFLA
jgi:hypothetical protein